MDRPTRRDRGAGGRELPLLATFVVALVLVGAASTVFVGAYNGQRMAGLATRVQHAERALGAAELSHIYVLQALYLSAAGERGSALAATIDAAGAGLDSIVAESDGYLALSPEPNANLIQRRHGYIEAARQVLDLAESGNVLTATRLRHDEVGPVYGELREALLRLQRADVNEINRTSSALGRVADVVRFLLAFALPAGGITAYRWVMGRQRQRAEMRLRWESEREVSRAKDEFIANVSHELRTPLTGIVGFAQLLQQSDLDRSDMELVRVIVEQSAELSRMVDDLLTAARADANALTIQLQEVAIEEQVAEVVEFVELMHADVKVTCQEARVMVDPERLRQVLRNLLVNAHKHGGSDIRVRGTIKEDVYVCTVIDDGPGVPVHVEERLFSRFVHAGDAPVLTGSVGLGLAIVHELCRLMGCQVSYRRVRGKTWFSVTIPLAARVEAQSPLSLVVTSA